MEDINGEMGSFETEGELEFPPVDDSPNVDHMLKLLNTNDVFSSERREEDDRWPPYCDPTYHMPDIIEIKVESSDGVYYFPVSVQKITSRKLYLGGFRNKQSGIIYHNASTQTPTENKKVFVDNNNLRTRETQTVETRTVSIQSYREYGTQMERVDIFLDMTNDKTLIAKEYYTSKQLDEAKRIKAIEIQRCWRGFVARTKAARINALIAAREKQEFQTRTEIVKREKERLHKELEHKLNPSNKLDFALLFNELDTWRRQEVTRIKATTQKGDERRKAMCELLSSETKALESIQQLKLTAARDTKEQKTDTMLGLMCQPHRWRLSDGNVAQVNTPAIQRARELYELYNLLTGPLVSVNQRLEVLLNVKWTIKAVEPCMLTKTLSDLLDRESDLLNRGRPFKSMESLRFRIKNLFLQFIEDPTYNPRAADFIKIPAPPVPSGGDDVEER
jgi:hypothetical protein